MEDYFTWYQEKSPQEKILTLVQVHWFVQPYISEVHLLVRPWIFYLHMNTVNNSWILIILTYFCGVNISCALVGEAL